MDALFFVNPPPFPTINSFSIGPRFHTNRCRIFPRPRALPRHEARPSHAAQTTAKKDDSKNSLPAFRPSPTPKFLDPIVPAVPVLYIEYEGRERQVTLKLLLELITDVKVPERFTDLVAEAWMQGDLGLWGKWSRGRRKGMEMRRLELENQEVINMIQQMSQTTRMRDQAMDDTATAFEKLPALINRQRKLNETAELLEALIRSIELKLGGLSDIEMTENDSDEYAKQKEKLKELQKKRDSLKLEMVEVDKDIAQLIEFRKTMERTQKNQKSSVVTININDVLLLILIVLTILIIVLGGVSETINRDYWDQF